MYANSASECPGQSDTWSEKRDELEEGKDGLSLLSYCGGGWGHRQTELEPDLIQCRAGSS